MAEITVNVDPANDLAFFVVKGIVSADEIIAVAREQASFKMAKHLVDMTEADLHLLDVSNLTAITEVFSKFDNIRSGGRTAGTPSCSPFSTTPDRLERRFVEAPERGLLHREAGST